MSTENKKNQTTTAEDLVNAAGQKINESKKSEIEKAKDEAYKIAFERPPLFRKSYSNLSSLTSFIECFTEYVSLNASNNESIKSMSEYSSNAEINKFSNSIEKNLFQIPYSNIKSINITIPSPGNIGSNMEAILVVEDTTNTMINSMLYGLYLRCSDPSFGSGGLSTMKIKIGWVTNFNNLIHKELGPKKPVAKYSDIFDFNISNIDVSMTGSRSTYTIKLNYLGDVVDYDFDAQFKPYKYLSNKPLYILSYAKRFSYINQALKEINKDFDEKIINSLLDEIKNIKNVKDDTKKVLKEKLAKLMKYISVTTETAEMFFTVMCKILQKKEFAELMISAADVNSSMKTAMMIYSLGQSFLTSFRDERDVIFNEISVSNRDEIMEYLNPICKEDKFHPYIALLFLIKQMINMNEKINEQLDTQKKKNKLIIVQLFDEDQVEHINLLRKSQKEPNDLSNGFVDTEDKVKAWNKEKVELVGVSEVTVNSFKNWTSVLSEVCSKIKITPGKVKDSDKKIKENTKSLNCNFFSFKAGTEKYDNVIRNLEELSKIFKEIQKTQISSGVKNVLRENAWEKTLKEIKEATTNHGIFTLVIFSEKDLNIFSLNKDFFRITQSYTVNPNKNPNSTSFNSGSIKLNEASFPDVISFEPKINNFERLFVISKVTDFGEIKKDIISKFSDVKGEMKGVDGKEALKIFEKWYDKKYDELEREARTLSINNAKLALEKKAAEEEELNKTNLNKEQKRAAALRLNNIKKLENDIKVGNEKIEIIKKERDDGEKEFFSNFTFKNKNFISLEKTKEFLKNYDYFNNSQTLIRYSPSNISPNSELDENAYRNSVDDFAKDLAKNAQILEADLKILGEPGISNKLLLAGNTCTKIFLEVNNITSSNKNISNPFFTGIWNIKKITHSIEGGKFTTSLNIEKDITLSVNPDDFFGLKTVDKTTKKD